MTNSEDRASNPLLNIGFNIPFDKITPSDVVPAVESLIASAKEELNYLAGAESRGFKGFIHDLDLLASKLDTAYTIAHHLDSVVTSDEWKAAIEKVISPVTQFYTEISLHTGLWNALKTYAATAEASQLDPVSSRLLTKSIDDFRRGGADLSKDKKEILTEISTKLAQVTNTFGNNVQESIAAYELYVSSERMKGVPKHIQDATRRDAEQKGKEGHRLTLHMPVLLPILTYADDRELRREMWEANNLVGQQEGRDNRPLISEILKLRREEANLLGFKNFADYVLQPRMAKTGDKALDFERDLENKTRPAFEKENAELSKYYTEKTGESEAQLEPYDIAYWSEKQRLELYDFDTEALRPYLVMENVLDGMFEVCRRIFGITVTEGSAAVWHPEVKFYNIHSEEGVHIASFYTDWYPRDSKRGGAWMNSFITGGPSENGFKPHLGLMCGNMTPPSEDTPSLLTLREVETVFHEFGHLLHMAMSRVPLRSLSGPNVPWDFVELPSQIMENWVQEREVLDLFARHYQTGELLPQDLFERMQRAENYRAGSIAMRQYSFGITDLILHIEYDPSSGNNPVELAREVMGRFYPTPLPSNYGQINSFNHLFSSSVGYGAGYYSYKWAEVLDADAFSRFANEGIFNRETGRNYVDTILSKGNSDDPAQLYRDFMGRDPDANALLKRSGLLS